MKKRTKISSVISSFVLSANLFMCHPVAHGHFEQSMGILNNISEINFFGQPEIDMLKECLKNDLGAISSAFKDRIKLYDAKCRGVSEWYAICDNCGHCGKCDNCDNLSKLMREVDAEQRLMENSEYIEKDLSCMENLFTQDQEIPTKEFTDRVMNSLETYGYCNADTKTKLRMLFDIYFRLDDLYFLDLYLKLNVPDIKDEIIRTKDLNILRKDIKNTIASNQSIMDALKLTVATQTGGSNEIVFNTSGWPMFAIGESATMKDLANAVSNWTDKNPEAIKNWWTSRSSVFGTRERIKELAYDETNGSWEPEDKFVLDILFSCLDSYV